jgi:DNA-binding Xre family transcriptional regulator
MTQTIDSKDMRKDITDDSKDMGKDITAKEEKETMQEISKDISDISIKEPKGILAKETLAQEPQDILIKETSNQEFSIQETPKVKRTPSKTIGQKLREIRINKGLKLQTISERSGIKTPKITFYEMDKGGMPTIPTLLKLARGLDCTIFEIIDEPLGRETSRCINADKCVFYNRELGVKVEFSMV